VSKVNAPDGLPWPNPRIAVDSREQLCWAFGYRPAPWQQEGERGPVHLGERDAESLICTMLSGPWESERANLQEGDYQLLGPSGEPIGGSLCIERKSMADLRGSLSRGHDRLMAEMERMAPYTHPVLIVEAPIEVLLGDVSGAVLALEQARAFLLDVAKEWAEQFGHETEGERSIREGAEWIGRMLGYGREEAARPGRVTVQSLLGSTLSILADHRIPALFLPSRAWAEYAAAWLARRVWRRWLLDHPEGLAAERARLEETSKVARGFEGPALGPGSIEDALCGPTPQPASAARVAELGGMPWSTAEAARRREAKRRSA